MDENNLRTYIDRFFDNLVLYDDYVNGHYYKELLKAGIDVFLDNENSYNAYEIYRTFFMIYQITAEDKSGGDEKVISIVKEPNTLLDLVKTMKKYEESTGDLIERQRDHFIHSVNVFLLGIAIYAQNYRYREYFKAYVLKSPYKKYYRLADGEFSDEEFLYRWGVASLFHDIGYPVEIIGKQLNKFLNDGVKSISSSYGASTAIDFRDFDEFNTIVKMDPNFADEFTEVYEESKFLNLFKPTDIVAHKIATDFEGIDVNDIVKHLDNFVIEMGNLGFIDHGFFSCILVLNSYGYLIQKYSKNHDFFFYPIVDSASAILLHNYYKNVLQRKFNLKDLHPSQSPLAFLLILCDELQEWNRQPFGIKDKQKGHVNELLLKIDDDSLDVHYIVKSGSMGLGFSEDKEKVINNILSIRSTFRFGLRIITDVKQYFTLNETMHEDTQAPDILLRNVETLAVLIHNHYNETVEMQYREKIDNGEEIDDDLQKKYDQRVSFDELTPQLKIANIRQARSIPVKLDMIGCEIAANDDERPAITQFSEEEIEDLAIYEHDEWCKEKEGTGWIYGEEKDVENLITPYLVPWDDLTEDIKDFDREPIREIPSLMQSIGLKVVRSKIRLLTFEMHNLHDDGTSFDDLPNYIKYSNYKQTDFIIKILSQRGYSIVDADSPGEAVEEFDHDTVDFFAEREHEAWYKLKVNLGWTYGSVKDDISKTNPNLVEWNALDFKNKEANRLTFRKLPDLCKKVDLKIVKN